MIQRILLFLGTMLLFSGAVFASSRVDVISTLNQTDLVSGSEEGQAWRLLFDACLKMKDPPKELSSKFNMNTVWPGMQGWEEVARWASENEHMEAAILGSASRVIIGLPYGNEHVPETYRQAGIIAEIGVDDRLHVFDFSYIQMVKRACLWATAESYRLYESGEFDRASKLAMAELIVLRKFCDRIFLEEKLTFMRMLGDGLSNFRDMMYTYRDSITPEKFREIARQWIPYLRVDSSRLLIPIGDQIVGKALLAELFHARSGAPDSAKFREILTDIQVAHNPMTRFGASRFWQGISSAHNGLEASLERFGKIYDDWWRRWRMRSFHPQLKVDTQLDITNPVKYAAVLLVVRDINELFNQRDVLGTQINSTAVSAALCGYKNHFGRFPKSIKMMYAQFLHRSSNLDRFAKLQMRTEKDWSLYNAPVDHFHYRRIDAKTALDTKFSRRIWIEPGSCILYSVAQDLKDDRGSNETKDLIFWPPMKTLERTAGILD